MATLNTDAVITKEMLAKARERVGVERPITQQWHSQATRDTILHWAEGIGDANPLWTDADYARRSPFGRLVAPPTFIFSCNQGPRHRGSKPSTGAGLPGIHKIWAGDTWEWRKPILEGDDIHGTTMLAEIVEHQSEFAGRSLEEITQETFRDQNGEIIAIHRMSFLATERATASKRGKRMEFKKHRYTEEELAHIEAEIDREVLRGAEPRLWDDVGIGEEIPHVVKGPLTATEMITFVMGWGGPFMMASEIAHHYLRKHPRANVPDRETNAPDFAERAHWDEAFARECGFPTGYDIGAMRTGWMGHSLTNWMGDTGVLASMSVKFTKFNLLGDTTWAKGRVTGKHTNDGKPTVDLEIWCENQRGETTAVGQASVILPGR